MASEQSTLVSNLRKVITLVDRLRDVGLNKFISLPRIAVLGSQSSGKSSLLEQIVGLDFLPRGEGTVTRRPLELRLVYVPKEKLSAPYGIFEEIQGQKFSDFAQVKANIDRLTDSIAGSKKGIVDKPIVLTIFSSTCPDLTIIDLPGITKIPISGSDQTVDVEKVTSEMAARYCRDPKTIILCVIPANADVTTSDGLKMARQLDPQGTRTIGVITKIDIMDRGTDAKRLLTGEDVALKLGYVGVKNRSQADINEKKTVLKALEEEVKFFATSPVYSSLPQGLLGTRSLTNKLTDVLYTHIRATLPEIIVEIQKQITEKETRLKELGPGLPEEDKDRIHLLWRIVNDFSAAYKNSINGSYDRLSQNDKKRLPAGHRIRVVLNDLYSDIRSQKPTEIYSDIDVKNAIIKHEGDSIPGFPSIDAFLYLLTPLLEKLKEPAFECINEIYMILEEIAAGILVKLINKAPALKEELQETILGHFKAERDACKDKIEAVIESEIGYIFTNDVDYLTNRNTKQQVGPAGNAQNNSNQRISGDPIVHELRNRLDDYFYVVLRGIRDSVPKMIGFFLVKASQNKLQQTLFEVTSKFQKYFSLMAEPQHLVEERKTLSTAVETLKASIKMIKKDPDFYSFLHQADKLIQKEEQKESAAARQTPPPSSRPSTSASTASQPTLSSNNSFTSSNQQSNPPPPQSQQQQQQQQQNQQRNIFPPARVSSGQQGGPNNPQSATAPPAGGFVNNPNTNANPQKPVNAMFPQQGNNTSAQSIPYQPSQNQNPQQQQQPQQQRPPQQQVVNPLFGAKYTGQQKPAGTSNPPPATAAAAAAAAGGAPANSQQQQTGQQSQQQPAQQPFAHKAVDKAVDKAFESPAFQQGLSNAASAGAKQAFGNNAVGEAAGNLAGKAVQNDAVQNALKNQAKEQGKAQVDQKSNKLWPW